MSISKIAKSIASSALFKLLIICAFIVASFFIISSPLKSFSDTRAALALAQENHRIAQETNAQKKQQLKNLSDPAYIMSQARGRQGFILPGDVLIRVSTPIDPNEKVIETNPDQTVDRDDKVKPWYELLRDSVAAVDQADLNQPAPSETKNVKTK